MFNIIIPVTQDHIKRGDAGGIGFGAIALAIDERIKGAASMVYSDKIALNIKGRRIIIPMESDLRAWVACYNQNEERVRPFELWMLQNELGSTFAGVYAQEEAYV